MAGLGEQIAHARVPTRLAYLVVLAAATLSGLEPDLSIQEIAPRFRRALSPSLGAGAAIDAVRNVLLFAGWGLTWMATAGPGSSLRSLKGAVVSGAAASLVVELVQLSSTRRVSSFVDLATNTLGSLGGALALITLVLIVARLRRACRWQSAPLALVAAPLGAAAIVEAVVPLFRHTPVRGAYGWPWERARIVMGGIEIESIFEVPWLEALLFVPAGVLVVAAVREFGSTRGDTARLIFGGAVVLISAEFAHAPLGYDIVLGSAALHVGAWITGVILGATVDNRPPGRLARPPWLYVVVVGVVLSWLLRPYAFGGEGVGGLAPGWWIPLGMQSSAVDVFGMADVLNAFLVFLPVGAVLALRPMRRKGPFQGVLPGLYLVFAVEAGQLMIAARTPDGTDVLVGCASILVAWIVTRRAGFNPTYGSPR